MASSASKALVPKYFRRLRSRSRVFYRLFVESNSIDFTGTQNEETAVFTLRLQVSAALTWGHFASTDCPQLSDRGSSTQNIEEQVASGLFGRPVRWPQLRVCECVGINGNLPGPLPVAKLFIWSVMEFPGSCQLG